MNLLSFPPFSAGNGGGLLLAACGNVALSAPAFDGNAAAARGGGASAHYVPLLAVASGYFAGGTATNGSGLALSSEHTYDPTYSPPWINPLYTIPDITDIYPDAAADVRGVAFDAHSAAAFGGGVHLTARAVATFAACAFTNNTAADGGGALAADGVARASLAGGALDGNAAGGAGGGAHVAAGAQLIAVATSFTRNRAGFGGGLYAGDKSNVVLDGCVVQDNIAVLCGGGVAINSSRPLALRGAAQLSGNRAAGDGGAVCALRRDEATLVCAPTVGEFPFLCALAGDATVIVRGNSAAAGGGAFAARCTTPEAATAALWAAGGGAYADAGGGRWQIDSNRAGFGAVAATQKATLVVTAAGGAHGAYAPGDVLAVTLQLRDAFNQTTLPAAGAALPFELILSLPGRADVPPASVFCDFGGSCSAAAAGVRLPWPAVGGDGGGGGVARVFAPWVDVRFEYRLEAGDATLAPAVVRLSRASCGRGTSYDAATQARIL